MHGRLMRTLLVAAGLCILISNASPAQTRHSPRRPRSKPQHVIPALSPQVRESIARMQAVNIPWIDSLESGAALWTMTGFWHLSVQPQHIAVLSPTINPALVLLPDSGYLPSAHSGNNALWYGEDVTGTYIGRDFTQITQTPLDGGTSVAENSGSAITPPINLVGQKTPLLSFWAWWEIEGIATASFDLMHVEASTDSGVTWNPLGRGLINPLDDDANGDDWKEYSSGGLGKSGKWIHEYFDLTSYAGQVVWIQFLFDTGDDLYNGFRGWLIDDISVGTAAAPAPTITQVSPSTVNVTQLLGFSGTGFVNGASVQVDSTTVDPGSVGVVSTTFTQFYIPSSIGTGSHSLRITNPDGKTFVKPNAFTVTSDLPPVLYSVTPDSAPVGVSSPITISGSYFLPGATVDIGGLPASGVQVTGAIQIQAFSPNKLPVGTYNVTVVNPDGLSDVSVLGFKVYTPNMTIAATGDSLVGNAQPLTVTPAVGKSFLGGSIFYRPGGSLAYDTLALTGTGTGPFTVNLPAKAITIRGVEYYVTLNSAAAGPVTFPPVNPAGSPAVFPVRLAKLATPLTLSPLKYAMFSAPMLLDNPDILGQLGDDYGAYNASVWRVFHWEDSTYREAVLSTAAAGPMTMVPGKAFWLVTAGGTPFTFKHGTSVPSVQPYVVPVDTGWNQIGDPFAFPVSWSSVGSSYGLYGPYHYDGTQYQVTADVLRPYEGYFVYNPSSSETNQLTFYPVDATVTTLPKPGFTPSALGPGEFVMQISASIAGTDFRDTYNYVGLRTAASAGRDHLDAPKPPPIGNALQVEIDDGGSVYIQNFKPPVGDGQSWVFDVRALGTKGDATLTLTTSGSLPAGYGVHVLDMSDENALPAGGGSFHVGLAASNAPHYFKVIMGTDAYAAKESNGIPLQPVSYALEQNYPNPFNPSTTIRYSLAKRSDVTLEIYSVLGQRVRTLFSGSQTTGVYQVQWDGTADNGAHVASGVYFYRLRTGEFTAVRKLVMIR